MGWEKKGGGGGHYGKGTAIPTVVKLYLLLLCVCVCAHAFIFDFLASGLSFARASTERSLPCVLADV